MFGAFVSALKAFFPGAQGCYYDGVKDEPVLLLQETVPFSHLSDGELDLVVLIGELARNAAMLNPHLGDAVLTDTPGIVLIDELELHLHPRWQRLIAPALMQLFPSIQFFCTTHSPQVISEVRAEHIMVLDSHGPRRASYSYGLESDRVLTEIMGVAARPEAIQAHLDEISRLIATDAFAQARTRLKALSGILELGENDPSVVEHLTYLSLAEDD